MKDILKTTKGFVLLGVIALSLTFIIIIIPLISWTTTEFSFTSRSLASLKALNLADAGAETAIWEVLYNNARFTGWSGTNPKQLTLPSFEDNLNETVGDITISALNTSPGNYLVTSSGLVKFLNSTIKKTVKVKVFPHPLFNNGIFAYSSITLSGNTVADSYNSDIGPYSPLNPGTNCDIGSNGSITRLENALIKGDAFIGANGSMTGMEAPYLTGEANYFDRDVELESALLPDSLIDYFITLPSSGNLALAGQTDFKLLAGDYRYESISVEAKAILRISSNTRIYVHNNFYVAGQATVFTNEGVELYIGGTGTFAGKGIVNLSGTAENLNLYGLYPTSNLSYTGLSDFYGSISAPQASIYLAGSANFYGAVVGDSVTLAGGIKFHYDEALGENGPFAGYDVAYWQEN